MKAPYRFVPLNKKVVYPDWSEHVSFDAPLKESLSGEIHIRLEAKTPIFVRDSNSSNDEHFFKIGGKFVIPGSSFKGEIRTLVEVLSFSKIDLRDRKLSFRDLSNPEYLKEMKDKTYHGWLFQENGRWKIESLGKAQKGSNRIKYQELVEKGVLTQKQVKELKKFRNAYEKYRYVRENYGKIFLKVPNRGVLVFTGTTNPKKTREFVFQEHSEQIYDLTDKVVENFKEAYYLDNPSLTSKDWKQLWGKKFEKGERIPVFFQLRDDKVEHFGLSMLYKLPYRYSILDLVTRFQEWEEKPDFVQTLFGYVEEKGKKALRGRVHFSHLVAVNNPKEDRRVELVLGSPRPTYYPYYLDQSKVAKDEHFLTYDDEDAILSGHKFYPPRRSVIRNSPICHKNPRVCTRFYPLKEGAVFEGKIRFFNLKPQELGALFAALTFLNQKGDYYHRIGMAKPYGYGTVKLKIKTDFDIGSYIESFVQYMHNELGENYLNNTRIRKLLEYHKFSFPDSALDYPTLKEYGRIKSRRFNEAREREKEEKKTVYKNEGFADNPFAKLKEKFKK